MPTMEEQQRIQIGELERQVAKLEQQLETARSEIATDDRLLEERNRLLKSIPACPEHGDQCVPHAIQWVTDAQKQLAEAEQKIRLWEILRPYNIVTGEVDRLRQALKRETKLRAALEYAGFAVEYPGNRIERLMEEKRATCTNDDDTDFWHYALKGILDAMADREPVAPCQRDRNEPPTPSENLTPIRKMPTPMPPASK